SPTRYTKGCGQMIAAFFYSISERRENKRSAVYLTIWIGFFYQCQVVFLCLKNFICIKNNKI
ncbi:MAG: hypothetical protein OXH16_00570, partial [Gemmatimonadetes bacterium]|nr:hypothetical protein [Gemmatimonadota bacterium]